MKNSKTRRKGNRNRYLEYGKYRNFLHYRCHAVPFTIDDIYAVDVDTWVTGRYSFSGKTAYFEDSTDAMMFQLKHA